MLTASSHRTTDERGHTARRLVEAAAEAGREGDVETETGCLDSLERLVDAAGADAVHRAYKRCDILRAVNGEGSKISQSVGRSPTTARLPYTEETRRLAWGRGGSGGVKHAMSRSLYGALGPKAVHTGVVAADDGPGSAQRGSPRCRASHSTSDREFVVDARDFGMG